MNLQKVWSYACRERENIFPVIQDSSSRTSSSIVGCCIWPSHLNRCSLIFSSIDATPTFFQISLSFPTLYGHSFISALLFQQVSSYACVTSWSHNIQLPIALLALVPHRLIKFCLLFGRNLHLNNTQLMHHIACLLPLSYNRVAYILTNIPFYVKLIPSM